MFNNLLKKFNLSLKDIEPAFWHISYANLNGLVSNERLEFLGDSIINYYTTLYLMNEYKNKDEGDLSKLRARMVSSDSLSKIFKMFKLKTYLKIVGAISKKIEANTVEAVVACVYKVLEQRGEREKSQSFVTEFVVANALTDTVDYKSRLQEHYQKLHSGQISYKTEKRKNSFEASAFLGEELLASGFGKSKKLAEQNAAEKALNKVLK